MTDPLAKKIKLIDQKTNSGKEVLPSKKLDKPKRKKLKFFLFSLLLLLLFLAIFLPLFLIRPLLSLKKDVGELSVEGKQAYTAFQAQDFQQTVDRLKSSKEKFEKLSKDYAKLKWLKVIPFANNYYRDGDHLVTGGRSLLEAGEVTVAALEPYADILGFEGEKKKTAEEMTAEERLFLALDTLDKIQPNLDQIGEKLGKAQEAVDQIDPRRYPNEIKGIKIREKVITLIEMIDSTAELATEVKPVVGFLKPLMGVPDEKKYLLLFQNDAELRPSGGFMTAYALLTVKNGRFIPGASFDIYTLDSRFGNRISPPEPIKNYLPQVYYWHLRDMNLSPDFSISMATFWENAKKVIGTSEVDGIIALDTKFLVDLLKVLGPIGVADWGNFSAENDPRCDCPQVFYELELYADRPLGVIKEERKGIIGPLMNSIMLNAMGSPRKKWPEFFNVVFENIQEKHILFYFFDQEIQKSIELLNAGGKIRNFDNDYLHINDCNFAGAKSNMFIEQEVNQAIEIGNDGTVTKTVVIDYKNPAPASNCNLESGELCLNGLYRDWFRLYVPKGSELIEAQGSEVEVKTYEEFGKTVFEGFYGDQSPLRPQGKAQLSFKYKLPFKAEKGSTYKLMIQKQPGTKNYLYTVKINGQEQSFELISDKELQFKI